MNNTQNTEDTSYPIRINRYLCLKGYCSRRQADRYIEQGLVRINNRKAVLGDQVNIGDQVSVNERLEKAPGEYVYLACYKPYGVVSHDPQKNERSVLEVLALPKKFAGKNLAPLGRLDKDSEGLMIFSDDGRIVNRLLSPGEEHTKEYLVKVDKKIKGHHLKQMENGVNIEGYITKPATAVKASADTFCLTLGEGKKHQIRRMCAALGYQVKNLKRTRIKNIELKNLRPGEYREITGQEKENFLKGLL